MSEKREQKKSENDFNRDIFVESTNIDTKLNKKDKEDLLNKIKAIIKLPDESPASYIESNKLQDFVSLFQAHNLNDEKDSLICDYIRTNFAKSYISKIIRCGEDKLVGDKRDMLTELFEYLDVNIKKYKDEMNLFLLIKRIMKEDKRYIYYIFLRSVCSLYIFQFYMEPSAYFLNDFINKIESFHNPNIKKDFLNFGDVFFLNKLNISDSETNYFNNIKYNEKFSRLKTKDENIEPEDIFKQFEEEHEISWINNFNLDETNIIINDISEKDEWKALEIFIAALKEYQFVHSQNTEYHIKVERENNSFIVLLKSNNSINKYLFNINDKYLSEIIEFCRFKNINVSYE